MVGDGEGVRLGRTNCLACRLYEHVDNIAATSSPQLGISRTPPLTSWALHVTQPRPRVLVGANGREQFKPSFSHLR